MLDSLCSLLSLLKWPWLYAYGFICARYDTTLLQLPVWTTCPKKRAIQKKFLCLRPGLELQDWNLIPTTTAVLHRHFIYHSVKEWLALWGNLVSIFCILDTQGALCVTPRARIVTTINRWPEKSNAPEDEVELAFPLSYAHKVVIVTTLSALIDTVYCCLDFCWCSHTIPCQREDKKPGPTIFKTSMRKV